jgi:tetratricopeptide (TPR) repeat protein
MTGLSHGAPAADVSTTEQRARSSTCFMEFLMFGLFTASRRIPVALALVTFALAPARLTAQSAAEHVAMGDKDQLAMNAPGALRHYEEALKADPKSYEALWKATRAAVDVGEYNADEKERERLYASAEQYARRAVEANPADAQGHAQLARALGRKALSLGKKDQVKYAGDVRSAALEALRINPKDPSALHVMGKWNYEVLRLSGITRFMAKTFLGGKVFDSAKWDDAQHYMEESVQVDPTRLIHHLDLARVYAARDNKVKAREQYELVMKGPVTDFNDRKYQAEAADEIKDVR